MAISVQKAKSMLPPADLSGRKVFFSRLCSTRIRGVAYPSISFRSRAKSAIEAPAIMLCHGSRHADADTFRLSRLSGHCSVSFCGNLVVEMCVILASGTSSTRRT